MAIRNLGAIIVDTLRYDFIKKSFLIPYNTHPIFSQIKKELEDTYNHIPEIDIEKVLRDILLILLPDGEWKE